jgi:hypothetical protein
MKSELALLLMAVGACYSIFATFYTVYALAQWLHHLP